MARIPEDEIERLKKEVSLERLVAGFGIELRKHGAADLIGRCPFHDDREPSLVVSPRNNLWNCLGACQAGGSVIDWVMRTKGVSFRYAVELLKADHPSLSMPAEKVIRQNTATKLEAPLKAEADDREALRQVVDYYHETLKQSPEALKYLAARGIGDGEALGHFRLGFANRTLGYRLPAKNRKAGEELRGRLQRLGIIRESGHEHFNGSLVIPVFDPEGSVRGMYGRKITASLREGTPLHLYLPGAHRGVWNETALEASKEIILCESLIDALTFWSAGFRNVTASYGVNGFTDDHRAAFRKHGVTRVWIAYDRDEAGEKAALSLSEELLATGVECFRVLFPKGMDANEYALKVTPSAKSLGVLINRAQWLGKGKAPERARIEFVPAIVEAPAAEEEEQAAAKEEMPLPPPVLPLAARVASVNVAAEVKSEEVVITLEDRRYRVRGLGKNLSYDMLRVNVLVTRRYQNADTFHVDTLDLYSARQRAAFVKQAATETGMKEEAIRRDVGQVLLKLEELQDEQIKKALEPKKEMAAMSAGEKAAALDLLEDPGLLDRVLEDFGRCGVVGEETNKLVSYLATVSRRLEAPLAVVVQSSSAAGKSSLMDAALAFVPEEERIQYSALTGQSLFYMGETDLKHKVLAIVEEEGASRAAYALKLLQSEGVLTIASTGKDPATGKLVTHQYRVEGPVMIFLTTTAIHLDEELLNRCLVLTVDEDRAQTQAIHVLQREQQTLEGLMARKDREAILKTHRNAQRLLRPLFVANPYARELTFPGNRTRMRRDHVKYLTLIRAIALLHQYQRPVRIAQHAGGTVEYIEATPADIAMANQLAHEVLGRSLDELPPQTRRLLLLLDEMAGQECKRLEMERSDFRFSRRDVRQATEWGDTQLRVHLQRLEEMEYLLAHRGGRGQSFVYELVFERGERDDKPLLVGLIDPETLSRYVYGEKNAGDSRQVAGSTRGHNGGLAGGSRGKPEPMTTGLANGIRRVPPKNAITVGEEVSAVSMGNC